MRTPAHRAADARIAEKYERFQGIKFRKDDPAEMALLERFRNLPMPFSDWAKQKLREEIAR